jgi:hypothetical protein
MFHDLEVCKGRHFVFENFEKVRFQKRRRLETAESERLESECVENRLY